MIQSSKKPDIGVNPTIYLRSENVSSDREPTPMELECKVIFYRKIRIDDWLLALKNSHLNNFEIKQANTC